MADTPATIALSFDGYWREAKMDSVPAKGGVYCIYTCTYNADAKLKPTVSIAKLVYIGEADDMKDRIANHEKWPDWKKHLTTGQVICISAAPVTPKATRQRAEAALIFKHKPPVNVEYAHSFPFDTTTINASGETAKLVTSFTVKKDAKD